jgi:hypothetical protein
MPIRLNLLAESQDVEDMRRRDPVKRAFLIGVGIVSVMLVWSASLWVKSIAYKSEISSLVNVMQTHASQNKEVMNNLTQIQEIGQKLAALDKLSANRFLAGNLLNALQQTTIDDVQLSRLRLDDNLIYNEEIKAGTAGRTPRAASVTEKIVLTLDARDSCAKPGDLIPKFQQKIAAAPYFDAMLNKSDPERVRLKEASYGALQMGVDNKLFQPFALECSFMEKTR